MELLDRALVSLQRTEDAYMDINNRIIDNVNQRKARLNNINQRVLGISQKILTLYGVNAAMRIVSPCHYPEIKRANESQHHPYQSMFFDSIEKIKDQPQQSNLPELSSIRLNKKLYNNRLQNEPENLKKLVSGVTKDINDISSLILSFQRYRSTISDFKNGLQSQKGGNLPGGAQEQSQGLLGRIPEGTESVAELMLFDSDINVYGDSNIDLPDFDFKTRKVQSKKEKQKREEIVRRQKLQANIEMRRKMGYKNLDEAPESIKQIFDPSQADPNGQKIDPGMIYKQDNDNIGYAP